MILGGLVMISIGLFIIIGTFKLFKQQTTQHGKMQKVL